MQNTAAPTITAHAARIPPTIAPMLLESSSSSSGWSRAITGGGVVVGGVVVVGSAVVVVVVGMGVSMAANIEKWRTGERTRPLTTEPEASASQRPEVRLSQWPLTE
eukprot:967648-Rhodomonas_salina.3